jgi:hypothetical protein
MSKHLVLYTGRTGSTLVEHHVSQNLCNPPFDFWKHDFYSTEIHPCEYKMMFDKLKKLNKFFKRVGIKDWSMKYLVSTGVEFTDDRGNENLINNKNINWIFDFSNTDKFFSELNITDLHFSFRIDCLDTICSYMIARMDDSFVVTDNEIREHKKRHIDREYIWQVCQGFQLEYTIYNEYVKRYAKKFNSVFYPYENLAELIDVDNDVRGMKKQLTKKQKQELIINYDEVIEIAKEYPFYHGKINEKTGVLEV